MEMPTPDFILLVIATAAAICAGWGYAMLGPPPNFRAARVLFWVSAVGFGSLGIVWAANGDTLPVGRIITAAIIGAVAAASLAWVLWELQIRERGGSGQPAVVAPPALPPLMPMSQGILPEISTPKPTAAPESSRADETGRIFVRETITPSYLVNIFRNNTYIDATAQTKKFIGKWMPVDGAVNDIYTLGPDTVIVVVFLTYDGDSQHLLVSLSFHGSWIEKILILKRGDKISVIGQIDTIDSTRLS